MQVLQPEASQHVEQLSKSPSFSDNAVAGQEQPPMDGSIVITMATSGDVPPERQRQ